METAAAAAAPPGADADRADDALFLAFAAGDGDAFDRLYERHRTRSYRYFLRQLPGDQADDCFQQLWLKVIDERHRFRPQGRFSAWLYTLAHRLLMDQHRQNRRGAGRTSRPGDAAVTAITAAHEPDAAVAGGDVPVGRVEQAVGRDEPEQALDRDRAWQRLLELLAQLPAAQRDAWLLQQEAGLSLRDIAAVTGDGIETIKSRLRYATRTLRAGLEALKDHD